MASRAFFMPSKVWPSLCFTMASTILIQRSISHPFTTIPLSKSSNFSVSPRCKYLSTVSRLFSFKESRVFCKMVTSVTLVCFLVSNGNRAVSRESTASKGVSSYKTCSATGNGMVGVEVYVYSRKANIISAVIRVSP